MGRVLKLLLFASFLSLSIGEFARISFDNISFTLTDVLVAFTFVSYLSVLIKNRDLDRPKLFKPLFIFICVILISLLINFTNLNSNQLFTASLYIVRFIFYVSFYFILAKEYISKKITEQIMISSGIVFIILGYIQYFFYQNLRNLAYLGWDVHQNRFFAGFLDPNFTSVFLILFLTFVIYNLTKHLVRNKKILYVILLFVTTLAIVLTYSRAGYICVGILFLFSIFYFGKRYFLPIFLIIFLVVLTYLLKTGNTENTNLLRKTSTLARIENYSQTIKIFSDHPIFGVGFDAYRYAQEKYGFIPKNTIYHDNAGAGADNSFLFILATSGIIGLVSFIWIFIRAFKRKYNSKSESFLFIGSLLILIISANFINSLFFPGIMLWFYSVLGFTESK